jgi:hypothetical protein
LLCHFVVLLLWCKRRPAAQIAVFEIGAKLGSFALSRAYAAGGYFFRFVGKSNQKGTTSL